MSNNIWKRSIFVRLILTFLIVMVPVYAIGIIMYKWGISSVKEEISNSKAAQISYFLEKMEREIQGLKLLQSDILFSDDINMLANSVQYMDDYEKGSNILRLQQRLNAIKSSSIYIENVYAIIPTVGKIIPAWGSIDTIQDKDMKMMNLFENSTFSQLIYIKGNLYLNAVFPLNYAREDEKPLYSVLIKMSTEEIRKALGHFNLNVGSGSFLMNTDNHFTVDMGQNLEALQQIKTFVGGKFNESDSGKHSVMIGKDRYLIIYGTSSYLGMTMSNYIPEKELFSALNTYKIWFGLFSAAAVGIIAIFSFSIFRLIRRPLYRLMRAFKRLEMGDLNFTIQHHYEDEFGFIYDRFNGMTQKLNTLIDQSYKQKLLVQKAELKQLQAQINPHFLYNSFFILYTMTKSEQYDKLLKFQMQLGEYFQFLTRDAADEVTLDKEINHARAYCDIQEMRFSTRIRVDFQELPPAYTGWKVPRLIIQPIIENAFQYGLEQREENGLLNIRFEGAESELVIMIEDNGESLDDQVLAKLQANLRSRGDGMEVTGILNIHRRIQLQFGEESGLDVTRGKLGGLQVSIKLKYTEFQEESYA